MNEVIIMKKADKYFLKSRIESFQTELNNLLNSKYESLSSGTILELSVRLDKLITEYYRIL